MRKDTSPTTTSPGAVAYFDHTATLGGGEIALLNLARASKGSSKGSRRLVAILGADGPLAAKLKDAGIEVRVLPLDSRVAQTRKDSLGGSKLATARQAAASLAYVWRLSRLVRSEGASILHTNSLKADVLGVLAGRLARVPVLWHVRDRITDEYLPPRAARLFRLACKYLPQAVAVNSRSTLESIELPESDLVRVVHDGYAEPGALQVLERGPEPLVGLVGRISPWKGQDVFVRAAALVLREFPEAKFQIIGSALFGEEEYESQVKNLARELDLGGALEFTGFRSDVEACIASLDILAHASTMGEPFGQVVMEGMAAGKPVVATRGGGVPEVVDEGRTGLLVPMGDAEAMAEAILSLLRRPEEARAMGEAGARRVRESFTIEQTAAKIEALYQSIEATEPGRKRFCKARAAVAAGALAAMAVAALRRRSA